MRAAPSGCESASSSTTLMRMLHPPSRAWVVIRAGSYMVRQHLDQWAPSACACRLSVPRRSAVRPVPEEPPPFAHRASVRGLGWGSCARGSRGLASRPIAWLADVARCSSHARAESRNRPASGRRVRAKSGDAEAASHAKPFHAGAAHLTSTLLQFSLGRRPRLSILNPSLESSDIARDLALDRLDRVTGHECGYRQQHVARGCDDDRFRLLNVRGAYSLHDLIG